MRHCGMSGICSEETDILGERLVWNINCMCSYRCQLWVGLSLVLVTMNELVNLYRLAYTV